MKVQPKTSLRNAGVYLSILHIETKYGNSGDRATDIHIHMPLHTYIYTEICVLICLTAIRFAHADGGSRQA